MTAHTYVDAGNSGPRALLHSRMAGIASDSDIIGMDLVGKIDWLLRLGPDIEEIPGCGLKCRMRRREDRRTPPPRHVRIGGAGAVSRNFGLLRATPRHGC